MYMYTIALLFTCNTNLHDVCTVIVVKAVYLGSTIFMVNIHDLTKYDNM